LAGDIFGEQSARGLQSDTNHFLMARLGVSKNRFAKKTSTPSRSDAGWLYDF
jgi:hypothetical protein